MQGHYDDQIGGHVGYSPQDINNSQNSVVGSSGGGGGGGIAGGAGGGIIGTGSVTGSVGGVVGVGGVAGGINGGQGNRIENDTKDVSASHMTNNSHNEMIINHNQPQAN